MRNQIENQQSMISSRLRIIGLAKPSKEPSALPPIPAFSSTKRSTKEISKELEIALGNTKYLLRDVEARLNTISCLSTGELLSLGLIFLNGANEEVGVTKAAYSRQYLNRRILDVYRSTNKKQLNAHEISCELLKQNIQISKRGVNRVLYSSGSKFVKAENNMWIKK